MTDLEQFQIMLRGSNSEIESSSTVDHGPTVSIVFRVLAGIAGSNMTIAEAFFDKKTGKFLAVHHCD